LIAHQTNTGKTAAMRGIKADNVVGLKALLSYYPQCGLDLSQERDEKNWTAFHFAASVGTKQRFTNTVGTRNKRLPQ